MEAHDRNITVAADDGLPEEVPASAKYVLPWYHRIEKGRAHGAQRVYMSLPNAEACRMAGDNAAQLISVGLPKMHAAVFEIPEGDGRE